MTLLLPLALEEVEVVDEALDETRRVLFVGRVCREKGVFDSRKGVRGDQIVEVAIQAPKVQDERTKELLRELASLHPEDPRADMWAKV